MSGKAIITWSLQILVAGILFYAGWSKLSSQLNSIYIFDQLSMEPHGRYIIGVIEVTAATLLLSKRLAATGAFLTLGTMLGAIIAHSSVLGLNVKDDGGIHIVMLSIVFISALIIVYVRRSQLPFIGSTLKNKPIF